VSSQECRGTPRPGVSPTSLVSGGAGGLPCRGAWGVAPRLPFFRQHSQEKRWRAERNTTMAIIDADAHVLETERTWSYMARSEEQYRPRIVRTTDPLGVENEWRLIDGRTHSQQVNVGHETPEEAREMADIQLRLRHMDELGV